jgi:hypothetical protein
MLPFIEHAPLALLHASTKCLVFALHNSCGGVTRPPVAVSFDASLVNNPIKKITEETKTDGIAAWNQVVGVDDPNETFGQCIAGE